VPQHRSAEGLHRQSPHRRVRSRRTHDGGHRAAGRFLRSVRRVPGTARCAGAPAGVHRFDEPRGTAARHRGAGAT
jgi:hypothetical protein